MKKISEYFIKFPLAVNLLMAMVFIFGIASMMKVQRNFFPNIETRNIYVDVLYPGASPDEIEEGAVLKIEENIKGIANIERITSKSSENMGKVTIEMLQGTDMDAALIEVKNAVDRIASFPKDVESVVSYKHDNTNFAINFVVTPKDGHDISLYQLKQTAREIEADLLREECMSKITFSGFPEEEIAILLDEHALESYGLSFTEIAQSVSRANLVMTGGSIKDGSEEFYIRVRNKAYSSRGVENIVIRNNPDGGVIRLRDVAEVVDQWADTPSSIWFNDKLAAQFTVNSTFNEDILVISDFVNQYIDKFNEEHPHLEAEIVYDMSTTLNQRIDLLMDNGIMGIILVLIFLSLFLNPRIAFWVAAGIPFSLLGMFIFIPATDVTINMLSLFGLILVLGILVDDAIVVAENIFRHWRMGKSPVRAAVDGSQEVIPAVVSGVLTTMVAFSAFMFIDGKMGDMMGEVSTIIITILAVSLLECLVVLPAHIAHSKALKKGSDSKWSKYMGWAERFLIKVRDRFYTPLLQKAIRNKTATLAIFTAVFMLSIAMVVKRQVNVTLFPDVEGDFFQISLIMPAGTQEGVTEKYMTHIFNCIEEVNEEMRPMQPNGEDVMYNVFYGFKGAGNDAFYYVSLSDPDTRVGGMQEIIQRLRARVGDIPGAETLNFESFNPFGKAIVMSVTGDDNKILQSAKEELKLALRNMPEISDLSDNAPIGNRELEITLKDKAYHLGLNEQQVIAQVREAFFGNEAQRIQRGKDEVKVWVRYRDENRKTFGQLEDMKIRLQDGSAYPLSEIASIEMVNGVSSIRHLDFDREVELQANQSDPSASLPDLMMKIEKDVLADLYRKYPGIKVNYDGQKRESDKTGDSISKVMPIILLLMLIIVILTLRSVSQAMLIYAMIPLSLIGVIFGHWFHGMSLSQMSMMGVIALIGVMVNDGLVLINALNINLKEGMNYVEALTEAGISRFRPIILTTLTTVVGMAPMVFETSMQAQFLIPVALSLAYGMIVATTTTLFLLPVMLLIVNGAKVKREKIFRGVDATPEQVENAIKELEFEHEEL